MEIYLKDIETNETKGTYKNVLFWGYNFVEYDNGGRGKTYCDSETEYFTDINNAVEIEEETEIEGEANG